MNSESRLDSGSAPHLGLHSLTAVITARDDRPSRRLSLIKIIKIIKDKRAQIAVVGLGYVGLPLVTEFARAGFKGVGCEVDQNKADQINRGISYIADVDSALIKQLVESGKLQATTDFAHLKNSDAIIICVPTPLRKTKEPDVSFILGAAEEIKKHLRRG